MGSQNYGIDPAQLKYYSTEIISATNHGTEIGIVIGGGNIFRGMQAASMSLDRIDGDYMGMLATVMNSIALKSELEKAGKKVIIFSGIEISPLCTKMHSKTAQHFLEQGYIVIIAGGTGNPFFTTDTAAALRALEIKAQVILKGTRVDGVYDSDPEKNPNATKYSELTFDLAYQKELNIMDLTAFTLCKENKLPIIVFDINTPKNLEKIILGDKIGTTVFWTS